MRETGPIHVRFKGDPRLAKAYVAEGRKYLGALRAQLDAGGISVGSRKLTNALGVGFNVQWVGGQAILEIDVSEVSSESLINKYLGGIVTRPRNAGTTGGAADGQNRWGQRSHVVLRGGPGEAPDEPSAWKTYYYDATTIPSGQDGGVYRTTPGGNTMFDNGLVDGGTIDWRDSTETLSVNWASRPGRASVYNAGLSATQVFHNGISILNAAILPSHSREIQCACLRKWEGQWYLLVAFSSVGSRITMYRCKVFENDDPEYAWVAQGETEDVPTPQWPRLRPVVIADCTLVLDYSPPQNALFNSSVMGQMSFNQSATEARAIIPRLLVGDFGGGTGGFDSLLEIAEVVIDCAELDAVTADTTIHGVQGEVQSNHTTWNDSVSPCLINSEGYDTVIPSAPAPDFTGSVSALDEGLLTYTYGASAGFIGTSDEFSGNRILLIPRSSNHTQTNTAYTDAALPILVEYEDDVPVYLYWQLGSSTFGTDWEADFGNTCAVDGYDIVAYFTTGSHDDTLYSGTRTDTAYSNSTTVWSGGGTHHRFYAVDKNGERWWDSGFESCEISGRCTGEASLLDVRERAGHDSTHSGTVSASRSRQGARTRSVHKIFHVDLRYRCIMAGTCVNTSTHTETQSISGSGSTTYTANVTAGWVSPYTGTFNFVTDRDVYQSRAYTVDVYAYGVRVKRMTSTIAGPDAQTLHTSSSATRTFQHNQILQYGFDRSSTSAPLAEDTLPFATLPQWNTGTGTPEFFNFAGGVLSEAELVYEALQEDWAAEDPETRGPFDQTTSGSISDNDTGSVDHFDVQYRDQFIQHSFSDSLTWSLFSSQFGVISVVDTETQAVGGLNNTLTAAFDGGGRMLTYKGTFIYSIYDFENRSVIDVATRSWRAEAGYIDRTDPDTYDEGCLVTFDSISGNYGAQLAQYMWPLSFPIFHKV